MISLLIAAAAPAAAATAAAAKGVAPKPGATPLQINLPTQGAIPQVMQPTWVQAHAPWLTHTLAGLFILGAVGLIVLLALQTTKQEGLSGTVGGAVQSAYRGRPGSEELLKRYTGVAAVLFVVAGTFLSLTGI